VQVATKRRFCRDCQNTILADPQQEPRQEIERTSADIAVKRPRGLFIYGFGGKSEEEDEAKGRGEIERYQNNRYDGSTSEGDSFLRTRRVGKYEQCSSRCVCMSLMEGLADVGD
jgi:hypothetical protein